jgi:hypothetical protein
MTLDSFDELKEWLLFLLSWALYYLSQISFAGSILNVKVCRKIHCYCYIYLCIDVSLHIWRYHLRQLSAELFQHLRELYIQDYQCLVWGLSEFRLWKIFQCRDKIIWSARSDTEFQVWSEKGWFSMLSEHQHKKSDLPLHWDNNFFENWQKIGM